MHTDKVEVGRIGWLTLYLSYASFRQIVCLLILNIGVAVYERVPFQTRVTFTSSKSSDQSNPATTLTSSLRNEYTPCTHAFGMYGVPQNVAIAPTWNESVPLGHATCAASLSESALQDACYTRQMQGQ